MSEKPKPGDKADSLLDYGLLRRLLVFLRPYKTLVILAVFLNILVAALNPLRPLLLQIAVDDYIAKGDSEGLILMVGAIVATLIFSSALQYAIDLLMQWVGQNTINDMRVRLFKLLQRFSLRFYDTNPLGKLITRVTSDVEVLNELFSEGLVRIVSNVFFVLWIVVFMFVISWHLALATIVVLPLLLLATAIFRVKVRQAFRAIRKYVAAMNGFFNEYITGIAVSQLFSREEDQDKQFDDINRDHTAEHIRTVFYYALFFPVVEFLGTLSVGIVIWYAAGSILEGVITAGVLLAFLQYSEMFFRPVRELAERFNNLQNAMASSERVFSLMDEKAFIEDDPAGTEMPPLAQSIEFRNVHFSYDGEHQVLRNVSFSVKKGETLAIVGATGAGKSSLMNLLCRFYEFQGGEILIDGRDIRAIKQASLRARIGIVLQDVFLFSRSIAENISLGDPAISRQKIVGAAEAIGADGFITRLPEGYDTLVRERGNSLSVGQRQLIAFSRALASDPDVLILDEATSSVDTATEQQIEQAIDTLLRGRTSIVIAHRLSTVQRADKILVLHHGCVYEYGSHQELLEKDGLYARLYRLQYKEQLALTNTNGNTQNNGGNGAHAAATHSSKADTV